MNTIPLRCAIVLAALASMMTLPLSAQKNAPLPSKAEATTLLDLASRRTNLWAVGSTPFHLRATLKSYGAKGEIRQGTFELWWASPARYRDEINWDDAVSVRIANNDSLWVDGRDAHRFDTFRILRLLGFPARLKNSASPSADKVEAKQIDGTAAICLRFTRSSNTPKMVAIPGTAMAMMALTPSPDPTTCLDAGNNLPVRIEANYRRLELGNYAQIGDKQFPRKLTELTGKGTSVAQVEIDALELFDPGSTAPFDPRAGIAAEPWCANMSLPQAMQLRLPDGVAYSEDTFISPYGSDAISQALLVFRVDEVGHPAEVQAFTALGEVPIEDKEKRALLQSSFTPASCGGKAIPWEFLVPDYPLQSHR
jgi:hypothetical protein